MLSSVYWLYISDFVLVGECIVFIKKNSSGETELSQKEFLCSFSEIIQFVLYHLGSLN